MRVKQAGDNSKQFQNSDLANTANIGCTDGCTAPTDSGGFGAVSGGNPKPGAGAGATAGGSATGTGFADAIAAIMRLPLSDDEKAEAVRRLLAAGNAKGTG